MLSRAQSTVILLAVAAVTLGACGDDQDAATPSAQPAAARQLNTAKVEQAITESIKDQRDIRAEVDCPSSVRQAKDENFVCVAKTKRGTSRFAVVQADDAGNVTYAAAN